MTRRHFLPLLTAAAVLLPYGAAQAKEASATRVAAQPYQDPRAENLARALDAIKNVRIRADIEFIASDELAGRDSPSPGLRIAARFLRSRLMRLGWTPGAEDSFFYEYALSQYQLDESASFAQLGDERLTLGEDYYLSRWSLGNRDITGEIVYVGGFDEEELEGVDVKGKWGLVTPGERLSRRSLQGAGESGILGFLIPADPEAEKTVAEIHGPSMDRMRRPSMRAPSGFGAPVLNLGEELSKKLLSGAELPAVGTSIGHTLQEAVVVGQADDIVLENVCGLWPGSDPKLRNEVIIISAHYDHVGSRESGEIYNGADDNGSGTTGLLAIAEALTEYGPMRRTVMLMWVSAEEKGLLGSAAWTKNPWLPEGMQPICNLNIDMIGRNAPEEIGITPTKARPEYNRLTQLVEGLMAKEGFTKLNSADAYWSRSDHANFSRNLEIPVAFLFSDVHEDYHQPTDTADKIDCDKLGRVARLVVRMVHELQTDQLDL